ncbi:hypothetical protein BIW11_13191 [Tropilaelaps mercedesae]|uniref:Uncharacterized protein n=1 Tax=Tropilaelaps mercedesae TaxID=418985 RepID=A0A1V9X3K5_9ACAR|nr:hypothetical protein BIW11_13191 [Tropilaelaps mercedesae]
MDCPLSAGRARNIPDHSGVGLRRCSIMRLIFALFIVASPSNVLFPATAASIEDSNDDYQEPPYVRPGPFKPCDLAELDKFLPDSIRRCALKASQGSMSASLIQQSIAMACMLFKKCSIFVKKGSIVSEDNEHHCLHGFMVQMRKTDVTFQAINLVKNIVSEKGYNRKKVIAAVEGIHDCVDDAGLYLPLHKHQLAKLVSLELQLLE